jgi:hypothetical protein
MFYRRSQHSYPDRELITGLKLADLCGVSCAAITKAKNSGRIDTFESSKGKELYHEVLSPQQFHATRDRRHVTTATVGQKAAGFNDEMAQAVAHRPEFDNPQAKRAPLPVSADVQALDFGIAMQETMDLATAKSIKEANLARLAKLKADEMEGRLVPKQQCAIAVYQLGANVQDKMMTMYSRLSPEICGYFKDRCAKVGVDSDKILQIFDECEHAVGEMIRKSCLTSLKDLASKTVDNILD